MNTKLIGAALVAVAFGGGLYLGMQRNTTIITDGAQGESYGGGFRVSEDFAPGQPFAINGAGGPPMARSSTCL